MYDIKMLGLFKIEFFGNEMISLCFKIYVIFKIIFVDV